MIFDVTVNIPMNTIKHTRTIAASADFLFDYSQRNSCRMDWDPFVAEVRLHDEHDLPSEGTEVTVRTWNRMSMTCRYVQFRRPDCIAIKMLRGPRALETFGGSWRFDTIDCGTSKATFIYTFTLKKGLRWLTPFAKLYFSWDMWRRLRALSRGADRAYSNFEARGIVPWVTSHAT